MAKEQDILSTSFLRSFSYKPNPSSNSGGMLPFNPDTENCSKKFRAMDNISNGFNGSSPFYNQTPPLRVCLPSSKAQSSSFAPAPTPLSTSSNHPFEH